MGGHQHYTGILSDRDLIDLIDSGHFIVDGDANQIFCRKKNGKYRELSIERRQNAAHARPSLKVRLYYQCKRRYLEFHRLVWLANARCDIPDGWEIHHRDEDQESNGWKNLFCLHKLDHAKLHRPEAAPGEPEYDDLQQFSAVPF